MTEAGTANSTVAVSKKTRRAFPPRSAGRMALASTTSLSGRFEVGNDRLLAEPPRPDHPSNRRRHRIEKVPLDFQRDDRARCRDEEPDDLAPTRHEDRVGASQQDRRAVAELADRRRSHVTTSVVTSSRMTLSGSSPATTYAGLSPDRAPTCSNAIGSRFQVCSMRGRYNVNHHPTVQSARGERHGQDQHRARRSPDPGGAAAVQAPPPPEPRFPCAPGAP